MEIDSIPEEINVFYSQLEELNSFDKWELIKQLKSLSDIYSDGWKDNLVTERIALQFGLRDGQLKSNFYSVSKDGKEAGFPLVTDFSKESIPYLKERAEKTKNPFLIARYYHILYEIEKNQKHAKKAIAAYKKIIHLKVSDEHEEWIIPSVQAILRLTEKSKCNVDETKKELDDLINNETITVYDRYYIIKELAESSLYKSYELKFYPELSLKWIIQTRDGNYFFNKELLLTAIKISINNEIETNIFYEKLAENEDILLKEHPEDSDFIKSRILAEMMEYYKKAKNIPKYEETRKEYTRVKSLVELNEVEVPLDEKLNSALNDEINRNVGKIISWDTNAILSYFSNDSSLFPDIQKTSKEATEYYKSSFFSIVSTTVFDINVNTKTLSEQENVENEILKHYQILFGFSVLPTFMRVLSNGVINGKISYQHVYNYLAQNSWYGQNFPKMKMRTNKNEHNSYNWLNLLAPALHNFFSQIEAAVLLGSNTPFSNWILSLDSLTLKFEGALRDFIRLTGASTSIVRNDEIREMLLEDLINSDTAKEKFTENDLALFKIVFTNKGENIRNNIAHCFYHSEDYSLDKIFKVLFCILRLGKYKLTPVANVTE